MRVHCWRGVTGCGYRGSWGTSTSDTLCVFRIKGCARLLGMPDILCHSRRPALFRIPPNPFVGRYYNPETDCSSSRRVFQLDRVRVCWTAWIGRRRRRSLAGHGGDGAVKRHRARSNIKSVSAGVEGKRISSKATTTMTVRWKYLDEKITIATRLHVVWYYRIQ